MAKTQTLESPYGALTFTANPTHMNIVAPHTEAGDWGLGWWHGREFSDEAYFARSFWRGELGAGPRPSAAKSELDDFVSLWGFKSELTLENDQALPSTRARAQAYAQGFNQGRKRTKETPWTPGDCYLLARTLGFLEWWETSAPARAFVLSSVQAGVTWERLVDLFPGLGDEPDRSLWANLRYPSPWSTEAYALLVQLRRFRPSTTFTLPASRSVNSRPLLGFNIASDVTDPGLPFAAVRIEIAGRVVRGLSRPGHPGFLIGRHRHLAWQAGIAVDDTLQWRVRERNGERVLAPHWAGAGLSGTLDALLRVEECSTVEQAQLATEAQGTAALDWAAIDSQGQSGQWLQGPRWQHLQSRDCWLPSTTLGGSTVVRRSRRFEVSPPGRLTVSALQDLVLSGSAPSAQPLLAALRFLLPDNEAGRALRRWTPASGPSPEGTHFEKMLAAVWDAFWEPAPASPSVGMAEYWALLPRFEDLLQAPHSAWFPSADKNRRLADAVRKAFSKSSPGPLPWLGRRALRPVWTEGQDLSRRILAATVAVVVDLADPGWKVFLTDDETEPPVFQAW